MDNHYLDSETYKDGRKPNQDKSMLILKKVIQFIGVILRSFGMYFLGTSIVLVIFNGIFDNKLDQLFQATDENSKFWLLLMQGLSQLLGFIIFPVLYIKYFNKQLLLNFHSKIKSPNSTLLFLLAILILLFSMPLVSWLQEWNKAIDLPESMDSIEKAMQASEIRLKALTEKLIYYSDLKSFLFAMVVIAILPAVGEELLFRGITQNEMVTILKNHHAAIWITGFLFSAMHMQFYGFFPRMLLGVTFGYLYYWSGNLAIPMFIHFLNNALTLIVMNLYKQKIINIDPESAESIPPITIVISLLVFIFLLVTFKKYNAMGKPNNSY
jgi:membrane protease YdiL (CAAX protease family)